MAKKKKKGYKGRNWYSRFGLSLVSSTSRSSRRRSGKYRRAPSYWMQHGELTFSKIFIRDVEKIWFDINTPSARIVFKAVPNHEACPRFRSGVWDGKAFFVTFATAQDCSKFKAALWNYRG